MQDISILIAGHCMLFLNAEGSNIAVLSNTKEIVSFRFAMITLPGYHDTYKVEYVAEPIFSVRFIVIKIGMITASSQISQCILQNPWHKLDAIYSLFCCPSQFP